ncbi:hypothetical protein EYF80_060105 [Liparis tanakae]|uniref:Uncharacterized protein n=1 Tax=Liparis tanakae TaxID=230148 RepID=A0A4Z2ELB0_9TELE|nr:hypothetical protein EYF80_060105 [Liparis tanakae]
MASISLFLGYGLPSGAPRVRPPPYASASRLRLTPPPHASASLSDSPDVKSTMDLRQEYSAVSTCSAFSFSTCSWNTRMWSMKATTRSADMGEACRPAAASRGATWSGMEHWAAFSTNSSLHDMRNSAT